MNLSTLPTPIAEYELEKCLDLFEVFMEARLNDYPGFLEALKGKNLTCSCLPNKQRHSHTMCSGLQSSLTNQDYLQIACKSYPY